MSGLSVDYSLLDAEHILVMKFPCNRDLSTHLASFMLQWHVGTPYCFVATLFQCDVCVALHIASVCIRLAQGIHKTMHCG